MTVSSENPPVQVGFDAGWAAGFRRDRTEPGSTPELTLDRAGHDAEITVSSGATFRAATFSLAVDGLTQTTHDELQGKPLPLLDLAMGWRDSPGTVVSGLGGLAGALGGTLAGAGDLRPVLSGRVTRVERAAGEFRYRTTMTGMDAAWARLCTTLSEEVQVDEGSPLIDYVTALCDLADVPVVPEGDQPSVDGRLDVPAGVPLDEVILHLVQAANPGVTGTDSLLFLREGRLHVGRWRGPVDGGKEHTLDASAGLVDVVPDPGERTGDVPDNPYAPTTADAFTVTLMGRPDILVGDVVRLALPRVVPPPVAATVGNVVGALGVLAAPFLPADQVATELRAFRVLSVEHRLGRTTGFATTLKVEAQPEEGAEPATGAGGQAGEEHRLAEALDARTRRLAAARRAMDVGLVNRQSTQPGQDGSATLRPQRLQVRSGLAALPAPNVGVRADLADPATQLVDKPYLTPFAFGSTGLVVPHYPGSRVVHLNQESDVRNAMVAGCVWEEGEEPVSEPGDWWLTLPTGVSARESSDDPAGEEPQGKVSSDLIDGDGGRDIAVRGLRISVGETHMPEAGDRPESATADEIVIRSEHGGATIRVDPDGNIEISTDAEIRFRASKVTFDVDESVEVQ